MPSVPLFLVEKAAAMSLEEAMPDLLARRVPVQSVASACGLYRRIGICQLLQTGVPDDFFESLALAAQCLLHWLESAADGAKVGSLSTAFFDAIACGADDLAVRIARASPASFRDGEEYEEEFLHLRFVMSHFRLRALPPEAARLLERWELLTDGADPRAALCRAVFDRDQDRLDAALPRVVERWEEDLADGREAGVLSADEEATTARVFVELLALLRLAAESGLKVEPDHPRAPSCARLLDRARPPAPGAWSRLPSYRQLT